MLTSLLHHLLPLEITEHRDDDIKSIEAGLERDVFIEIQPAGDHIDHNPYKPLFQVFASQGPDAYDAQGGGEGIEDRDVAVGETRQQKIDGDPNHGGEAKPNEGFLLGHVAYGKVSGLLLVAHPGDEAVDSHGEVIKLHATVGVETFLIVQYNAEALHNETHNPHPDTGLIFQEDVGQSKGRGSDVKPMV